MATYVTGPNAQAPPAKGRGRAVWAMFSPAHLEAILLEADAEIWLEETIQSAAAGQNQSFIHHLARRAETDCTKNM